MPYLREGEPSARGGPIALHGRAGTAIVLRHGRIRLAVVRPGRARVRRGGPLLRRVRGGDHGGYRSAGSFDGHQASGRAASLAECPPPAADLSFLNRLIGEVTAKYSGHTAPGHSR